MSSFAEKLREADIKAAQEDAKKYLDQLEGLIKTAPKNIVHKDGKPTSTSYRTVYFDPTVFPAEKFDLDHGIHASVLTAWAKERGIVIRMAWKHCCIWNTCVGVHFFY